MRAIKIPFGVNKPSDDMIITLRGLADFVSAGAEPVYIEFKKGLWLINIYPEQDVSLRSSGKKDKAIYEIYCGNELAIRSEQNSPSARNASADTKTDYRFTIFPDSIYLYKIAKAFRENVRLRNPDSQSLLMRHLVFLEKFRQTNPDEHDDFLIWKLLPYLEDQKSLPKKFSLVRSLPDYTHTSEAAVSTRISRDSSLSTEEPELAEQATALVAAMGLATPANSLLSISPGLTDDPLHSAAAKQAGGSSAALVATSETARESTTPANSPLPISTSLTDDPRHSAVTRQTGESSVDLVAAPETARESATPANSPLPISPGLLTDDPRHSAVTRQTGESSVDLVATPETARESATPENSPLPISTSLTDDPRHSAVTRQTGESSVDLVATPETARESATLANSPLSTTDSPGSHTQTDPGILTITPDNQSRSPTPTLDETLPARTGEAVNAVKLKLIAALKTYSSPYKSSVFGHHHEARIQAVIKAIQETPSLEIAELVLKEQLSLMKDETPSLSNSISTDLLSKRWQSQLPKHRALTAAQQSRSGYVRALENALNILSRELSPTSGTERRTSRSDTSISTSAGRFSYSH